MPACYKVLCECGNDPPTSDVLPPYIQMLHFTFPIRGGVTIVMLKCWVCYTLYHSHLCVYMARWQRHGQINYNGMHTILSGHFHLSKMLTLWLKCWKLGFFLLNTHAHRKSKRTDNVGTGYRSTTWNMKLLCINDSIYHRHIAHSLFWLVTLKASVVLCQQSISMF